MSARMGTPWLLDARGRITSQYLGIGSPCGGLRGLPFASVRAAIYVQDFTGGECGVRQVQNCVHDLFDFTDPADRMQPFEKLKGLGFMHRSVDDARGNGVYANAILCVFDGECAGHRIQTALDHDLNVRRDTCDWLVNESGGDVDDA